MAKINYDFEEDILAMSKGKKAKESIDIGDFIVDLDHQGFVVGIEILNASENLKINKQQLKLLKKASMVVRYRSNCIYVSLVLNLKEKEKDITIPFAFDSSHSRTQKTVFT
ncbi:MAG: DUF2283 domain-containing protein [Nanoarchaeota archaeon]|nr:DUF2283 domain-containing protein [Nanoarchaeota archaeon]